MHNPRCSKMVLLCALSIPAVFLAGCSSQGPHPYTGIGSSSQLRLNQQEDAYRIPYRYQVSVDWRQYHKVMLEPVTIYKGADGQFSGMDARDKMTLAKTMTGEFSEALSERFQLASAPSAETLRIRITLTGAETTTPGLSTFSRFDIGMGSYNLVQSMRDREGTFTGSVTYAVEIFDASTSRLLEAYVTKQYPTVYDISSTFGSLTAAKTGIANGAKKFGKLPLFALIE
ncbi:DUF3313 domain-containing protein [Pseudomonas syringae pv. actinidiae]|nr:DUF3313 domain-containing protein [Pseudomonas syringae pv. actinidiae]